MLVSTILHPDLYPYLRRLSTEKRMLFIVFTIRNNKVRAVSARDMKRKERTMVVSREN